ncbi:MAG: glycosyltransferase family 2 protein [Actinobacteria bacterium]|nr:glycosyltransferase family 2 protein [Actinomycetota bacterium]
MIATLSAAAERCLVSVVVPTYNEERSVSTCLDSVLAQTWTNLEVLVVDGGSTDRTREIVADYAAVDPRVRLVHNPRKTQPAAMNTAIDEVTAQWMVRVDAHSTVPPTYVERVMRHLGTGRWGGVGGRKDGVAVTPAGRAIVAALGSKFGVGNSKYHHATEAEPVDHIPFGAYPVAVVRELGGWDEQICANEDFEFDYRVRQSGRELLLDPEIVIFWQTREKLGDFFNQYRRYGRGKAMVLRKHPESASPRHVLPAVVVAVLMVAALVSIRRPKLGLALAAPYFGGVAAASASIIPNLTVAESARYVPGALMAMHLGYGWGLIESAVLKRRPGS